MLDCLATGWVSSAGRYVNQFESMVADVARSKFGVATSSGTAALHLALIVAGVQPDDEVLVSDLTFVAPVNAIRYVGAWPVLVDAEPHFWQMDVSRVEQFLTQDCHRSNGATINSRTGRRVRAIIPVHILGHAVDMDPLLDLAGRYDLVIIEDATESLGGTYKGRPLGSIGRIGCFSFNGNKLLTTGGGGMLVSDDEQLAKHARYLSMQAKDDPVRYVHEHIGFNYRLSNVQAAIGVGQMEQLDRFVAAKRAAGDRYDRGLANIAGVGLPAERRDVFSSRWLYTVLIDRDRYGMSNMELLTKLGEQLIETRPLWQPVHLNRPYRDATVVGDGIAERLYAQALSLPSSVGLTDADQDRVIASIAAVAVAR